MYLDGTSRKDGGKAGLKNAARMSESFDLMEVILSVLERQASLGRMAVPVSTLRRCIGDFQKLSKKLPINVEKKDMNDCSHSYNW